MRNSRLFSLPPPFARPSNALATDRHNSDTSTLPYPTDAAIVTTPSALARGDWGLKRSLPLKSTARTSTPTIRIGDVDSINHITNFDSAADHVITLKKWQEISLPICKPAAARTMITNTGQETHNPHESVFEADTDNTEPQSPNGKRTRWKYKGPWLAGQTRGEFEDYLGREVKTRREGFRDFLRQRLVREMTEDRVGAARDRGEVPDTKPAEVSEKDLHNHIKDLRHDPSLLTFRIEEFLDLPSRSAPNGPKGSAQAEQAPPNTHPSAGLTYLRSNAVTPNHPILGPQTERRPVQGRVLAARSARDKALIGIGGIVSEDFKSRASNSSDDPGVAAFEPGIPGGAKIWVRPLRSTVDSQRRVQLQSNRADSFTVNRYTQTPQEEMPPEQRYPDHITPQEEIPDLTSSKQRPERRGGYNYGLGRLAPTSNAALLDTLGHE